MPWLKNKAIGRVYISELNLYFDINEQYWIDQEIFSQSKSLQEKVKQGILQISNEKNVIKHNTENKKIRKKSQIALSKFFPYGQAKIINYKEIEENKSILIKKALEKVLPKNKEVNIKYEKNVSEIKIEEILKEQRRTNEILEKLYEAGINITIDKKDPLKEKIPDLGMTYIPNIDFNDIKSSIKLNSESKTNQSLNRAASELKKLKNSDEKG